MKVLVNLLICVWLARSVRYAHDNFPTLPTELRARYLALGIVQRFIVERTTNRVGT